jgi:dolichol kinase
MTESLTITDSLFPLSRELHRFVTNLQKPRITDGKWAAAARVRCQELSDRASAAMTSVAEHRRALRLSLERISGNLRAYAQELEESRNVARLRETYRSLTQGYELLRVELERYRKQNALQGTFTLHRLKTSNYARNVFHMAMGLTGVLVYEYLLSYRQTSLLILSLCALFLTLEVLRRFFPRWNDFMVDRLFGAISRPWERHQVNSSTYYAIGLAMVTLCFPKPAAQVGVLVLAFGDPVATLAGKAWGRWKIWKEKSFVGSGAFVLSSFAVTSAFLFLVPNALTPGSRIALALSVSLAGAVAELFSDRVDDNLTVPLLCAEVAYLWFPS